MTNIALIIDNYDSFTFNLSRYFNELKVDTHVVKNDELSLLDNVIDDYSFIVISPGPGTPNDAGISLNLIQKMLYRLPILGICLGHQCLAQVLGAKVISASRIIHGKTTKIMHNDDPLFLNTPRTFNVTRYHSLAVSSKSLPETLQICAWSQNEIMAIKHRDTLAYGLQFHPEAFLTDYGHQILYNFVQQVNNIDAK
jgi:anthranilate synthase component 2